MASLSPERTKVFISYSHKDAEALERLLVHLAPYKDLGLECWEDTRIEPGSELGFVHFMKRTRHVPSLE